MIGQEAAFGGVGDVAVGQQVAFSRLRIRIDDLPPGASYHVVTPYGERDVEADDRGRVFVTEDQGCLAPPCGFESALGGPVGPFLRWDSGAPEGYVGDPNVVHTVTGSPTGQNFFSVTGADIGGPGVDVIRRTCSPSRAGSPSPAGPSICPATSTRWARPSRSCRRSPASPRSCTPPTGPTR